MLVAPFCYHLRGRASLGLNKAALRIGARGILDCRSENRRIGKGETYPIATKRKLAG
jgi:hypothetical protein